MVTNSSSSRPRIGYVVKRYPRFSETFIVNEILAHEAAGLEIEIFSLKPCIDTHFQNVISKVRAPVFYMPSQDLKPNTFWRFCHRMADRFPGLWTALAEARHATVFDAYQAVVLAREICDRGILHLHAHFATSAATVAQLAARIAGVDYSITMHAKDIFHESVVPEDLQAKIRDARFVVTVSDFNRQFLSANYGFGEKIHRVYNGLDLELFDCRPDTKRLRRILAVGRLVAKKGFRYLVDACRILADRGVAFDCQILGTGELETELRRQIDELSLVQCVKLVGPQPQNVVRELIRSATVFAAPCIVGDDGNRDGLPTVITESLALGTPCVATDVTGIPELVRHDETGVIVPQADAGALADALERLLDDRDYGQRLAIAARKLIESDFDIHGNVARIRDLFPVPMLKAPNPAASAMQIQEV